VAETLAALIARAVVHLNFNEADQARDVLLEALTEFSFGEPRKENSDVHAAA
jgi:hypothetical protein